MLLLLLLSLVTLLVPTLLRYHKMRSDLLWHAIRESESCVSGVIHVF